MNASGSRSVIKRAVKIMELHLRALKLASSDDELLQVYAKVIEFVDNRDEHILRTLSGSLEQDQSPDMIEGRPIRNMSLEKVEKLLEGTELPRRLLEDIAAVRFDVPRGSMRKWGAKEGLREKIWTTLRNERVHMTIGEVARAGRPREPGSS
jgi:hypothetical protein